MNTRIASSLKQVNNLPFLLKIIPSCSKQLSSRHGGRNSTNRYFKICWLVDLFLPVCVRILSKAEHWKIFIKCDLILQEIIQEPFFFFTWAKFRAKCLPQLGGTCPQRGKPGENSKLSSDKFFQVRSTFSSWKFYSQLFSHEIGPLIFFSFFVQL